jgi:TonB family protein
LPQPVYPALAKQQRVSGQVTVEVTIDETGVVVFARAVSGPTLLRSAAVSAAKQAKFTPTMLSGQAVRAEGVINYNFVLD